MSECTVHVDISDNNNSTIGPNLAFSSRNILAFITLSLQMISIANYPFVCVCVRIYQVDRDLYVCSHVLSVVFKNIYIMVQFTHIMYIHTYT